MKKHKKYSHKARAARRSKYRKFDRTQAERDSWQVGGGYTKEQKWNDGKGQVDPDSPEIKALWAKFEANLKKNKK